MPNTQTPTHAISTTNSESPSLARMSKTDSRPPSGSDSPPTFHLPEGGPQNFNQTIHKQHLMPLLSKTESAPSPKGRRVKFHATMGIKSLLVDDKPLQAIQEEWVRENIIEKRSQVVMSNTVSNSSGYEQTMSDQCSNSSPNFSHEANHFHVDPTQMQQQLK